MKSERPWFVYTAVGLLAVMAAAALWPVPVLRDALAVVAGLAVVGVVLNLAHAHTNRRYDLSALRKVHERAELDEIELREPAEYDSVQCVCGETYASTLPVCPRCRRSQF